MPKAELILVNKEISFQTKIKVECYYDFDKYQSKY